MILSVCLRTVDWRKVETAKSPERSADDALVERTLAGDLHAYQELVVRYQQRAYAVALGVMGRPEDAEDVAQEAFLKAFRNLSSFRRESSFYTWLYRIVYNLSLDEKRRRYRHVENSTGDSALLDVSMERSRDGDEFMGRVARPEEQVERTELKQRIDAALAELSPEHRAVVVLREVEGLSYAEISETVGCSKGTVMSRLHHARKRLQKILREAEKRELEETRSS